MITDSQPVHATATLVAAIRVDTDATPLEQFAARELQRYLELLFGRQATMGTNSHDAVMAFEVRVCTDGLSDQGIRLAPEGNTLHVHGGSAQATLWAVYELVERWGVRYLLDRDVVPPRQSELRFPIEQAVTLEPKLRIRQWRVVNAMALGPESWGIADYRVLFDQLAKLKYNRILVSTWPYQPFLHFEVGGITRSSGTLFFGYRYPISDDMPGRWLFDEDEREFWNPDFPPRDAGYEALAAAGRKHLSAIMDYALRRGMRSVITAHLLDFPPEFAQLLPGSRPVQQVNSSTIVPGQDIAHDNEGLMAIARTVLQTTINTYPQAVAVQIPMPEHRQWTHLHRQAWTALNEKYSLDRIGSLDDLLASASRRPHFDGDRARREVCGDLVFLWFVDNLLGDPQLTDVVRRHGIRFIFADVAEELYPFLSAMISPGFELLNFIDYTASRIIKRREVLGSLSGSASDSLLIFTLHDDNVGCLPALASGPFHELMKDLRRHQWAGFSTRYFLLGDHDPIAQYIARAAWDDEVTPQDVNRDLIGRICGRACVDAMLTVFERVEWASIHMAEYDLSFGFPVPGMMTKHLTSAQTPQWLLDCQAAYQHALDEATAARNRCTESGLWFIDYWAGRLTFAIGYIECVKQIHQIARSQSRAVHAKNGQEAQSARASARKFADGAVQCARDMLEAYAKVARNRSDVGAVAVMTEYIYRPLKAMADELGAAR